MCCTVGCAARVYLTLSCDAGADIKMNGSDDTWRVAQGRGEARGWSWRGGCGGGRGEVSWGVLTSSLCPHLHTAITAASIQEQITWMEDEELSSERVFNWPYLTCITSSCPSLVPVSSTPSSLAISDISVDIGKCGGLEDGCCYVQCVYTAPAAARLHASVSVTSVTSYTLLHSSSRRSQ